MCHKGKRLGPTPDLLGDYAAPQVGEPLQSFMPHSCCSRSTFAPPPCSPLSLAYSTPFKTQLKHHHHFQLEAFSDIHPPNSIHPSTSEYHHHGTSHPVITMIYCPPTIKTKTLFKDLCYLCSGYRMSTYC